MVGCPSNDGDGGVTLGRRADEGEQISGCRQVRSTGTSREAGHDTQAQLSFLQDFLQDFRQCKLASVTLLSGFTEGLTAPVGKCRCL